MILIFMLDINTVIMHMHLCYDWMVWGSRVLEIQLQCNRIKIVLKTFLLNTYFIQGTLPCAY